MSAVPKPQKLTVAEYLAVEKAAEFKSEFYRGEMFAMAGASREHNRVTENLVVELGRRFLGGPCQTFSRDLRVRVDPAGLYTYPDLIIVCDPPQYAAEDRDTLVNPQVIVEVLSPSTERYDRGDKYAMYQGQPTIREVLLVSQDRVRVERFVRNPDETWTQTVFADPAGEFALATVPVRVPLADVYRGVELPEHPPLR
jgi:Uma2 family endonuclease